MFADLLTKSLIPKEHKRLRSGFVHHIGSSPLPNLDLEIDTDLLLAEIESNIFPNSIEHDIMATDTEGATVDPSLRGSVGEVQLIPQTHPGSMPQPQIYATIIDDYLLDEPITPPFSYTSEFDLPDVASLNDTYDRNFTLSIKNVPHTNLNALPTSPLNYIPRLPTYPSNNGTIDLTLILTITYTLRTAVHSQDN